MKVIMNIARIDGKVIISISGTEISHLPKEEAIKMAIEKVCMIKETDIDIVEII